MGGVGTNSRELATGRVSNSDVPVEFHEDMKRTTREFIRNLLTGFAILNRSSIVANKNLIPLFSPKGRVAQLAEQVTLNH